MSRREIFPGAKFPSPLATANIRYQDGLIWGGIVQDTRNFALPKLRVVLEIYNVLGQKVKTLFDTRLAPGHYTVTWDGRNDAGQVVAGYRTATLPRKCAKSDALTRQIRRISLRCVPIHPSLQMCPKLCSFRVMKCPIWTILKDIETWTFLRQDWAWNAQNSQNLSPKISPAPFAKQWSKIRH